MLEELDEHDDHNYSILENPNELRSNQTSIITKDKDQIGQVQEDDKWEKIITKIDSETIGTCIPTDVLGTDSNSKSHRCQKPMPTTGRETTQGSTTMGKDH